MIMINELSRLLAVNGYLPHGFCINWSPLLIWTYVISDILIFLAYFSMPMALVYFARRRKDFPYRWLLWAFATFIMACGATHLMGAIVLWYPLYGLDAALKAFTALISVATAVILWPLIPQALKLPSPGQLKRVNEELQTVNTALLAEKARQEELIRKLAEAHSQLLQSEKMASIGQLAAGVAHEINNPIGFVNSNLGTLQHYMVDLFKTLSAYEQSEGEMSTETRGVLTKLKQQMDLTYLRDDTNNLLSESIEGLQRVKRIVQDLKDFSHVDETGKQYANLEQGLDSTLNVVWNELKYKAEVVKEYGGIPEIECIPSQLNQVFMNLLTNAAQAIEAHGKITLRTGHNGENVWVEVEDTGKGIQPEHLDRIFEPFFTTKPVGTGTGLGLSLSYGIVQQHGGRIEVSSEVGKGSVFRVVLPQHASPAQSSATSA